MELAPRLRQVPINPIFRASESSTETYELDDCARGPRFTEIFENFTALASILRFGLDLSPWNRPDRYFLLFFFPHFFRPIRLGREPGKLMIIFDFRSIKLDFHKSRKLFCIIIIFPTDEPRYDCTNTSNEAKNRNTMDFIRVSSKLDVVVRYLYDSDALVHHSDVLVRHSDGWRPTRTVTCTAASECVRVHTTWTNTIQPA